MADASAPSMNRVLLPLSKPRSPVWGGKAPAGAAVVLSAAQRWMMLGLFALLVAFRLPGAWVHGRFQDEEATVFLAYAWHHDWADALFRPFAGYLNLGATATTLLTARLVQGGLLPLELAPYLTMSLALAVQCLAAALILFGRAKWLESRVSVAAALLMIAIMPATEEVFLNVMHIQFHLALCVGLILALDPPESRAGRICYGILLLAAPLCGPAAIVMLPLFLFRALIEGDRGRLGQCLALGAGAAIQLLLFYGSSPLRANLFDPPTLAAALAVRLLVLPLMGVNAAYKFGAVAFESREAHGLLWGVYAIVFVIAAGTLLWAAAKRRDSAIWLLLAAFSIAAVSLGFGMVAGVRYRLPSLFGVAEGERYNFLPLAFIGLALIVLAGRRSSRARPVFALLVTAMLLTGAIHFSKPLPVFAHGPSWPEQVAQWRRDHNHPLAVWPRPWAADLSDHSKPCPALTPENARIAAPRYCEAGWSAPFYDK